VEYATYVDELEAAGVALADAATTAGVDATVATCPGWDVRALLDHTGMVHRWARAHVLDAAGGSRPKLEHAPADGVVEWFRDGHAALVRTLRETASDQPCWAFLSGAPKTASFWARRQAHETSVHRADAESARGTVPVIEPSFALDGIGELLEGFYGRSGGRLLADPPFTLRVAPSDAGESWLVDVRPDRREVTRDATGPADCTMRGTAADLYLFLWNRIPAAPVSVDGDASVVTRWQDLARVTWS
jgi:uncharacterized protein (TIGR03083 family)